MSSRIIPGGLFDGGISPSGPLESAGGEPKKTRAPVDERQERLIVLLMGNFLDPETLRDLQQIVGLRYEMNKEIDCFLEKIRELLKAALLEEHEAAKKDVRTQLRKLDALRNQIRETEQERNGCGERVAKAMAAFRSAKQERENLSKYATSKAIETADNRIREAEQTVDAANKKAAEALQRLNYLTLTEMKFAQDELARLKAVAEELDAKISGRGYVDALGIWHAPREPML